jgi:hypothetical protein
MTLQRKGIRNPGRRTERSEPFEIVYVATEKVAAERCTCGAAWPPSIEVRSRSRVDRAVVAIPCSGGCGHKLAISLVFQGEQVKPLAQELAEFDEARRRAGIKDDEH